MSRFLVSILIGCTVTTILMLILFVLGLDGNMSGIAAFIGWAVSTVYYEANTEAD